PIPASLHTAEAAGASVLTYTPYEDDEPVLVPDEPAVAAPVGATSTRDEVSLFGLPGLALTGPGAEAAARGAIAAVLATHAHQSDGLGPQIITTAATLAALLPPGTQPTGLDPNRETYEEERLHLLSDAGAAVTRLETAMIHRRRQLDSTDLPTIAAYAEAGYDSAPPCVLVLHAHDRYAARITAVTTQFHELGLHAVTLGTNDGLLEVHVAADGTLVPPMDGLARLSTLTADDFADMLAVIRQVPARPEVGVDPDAEPSDTAAPAGTTDRAPDGGQVAQGAAGVELADFPAANGADRPVTLSVLGRVTLATTTGGPIPKGVREGSRDLLALLATNPRGFDKSQLAGLLQPDVEEEIGWPRVSTNLNAARRLLRQATGLQEPFIIYNGSTYRLDPDTVDVDLWRMQAAIARANNTTNDATCLAALREAAQAYGGEFATGLVYSWVNDHTSAYRYQYLNVLARIAELLEADHPDQAVTVLEQAIEVDPANEELYQRLIRIHGRHHRADVVQRTYRLLQNRLADHAAAEPSQATMRLLQRQLQSHDHRPRR
ncbi:MAG TPA: bacterial transcriptional activator domain-containing protein, partial [Pilimelia sp.]|nr:bacterial transcriptional activator domain-containing protein [Pilimelia sp.]